MTRQNKSEPQMEEEKLKELLNELAVQTAEPARPGLAEDIKHQIPSKLVSHAGGMGSLNIIVDLRVNRLVAAAVIIVAMILFADFFGRQHPPGDNIFQDGKMLVQYVLGGNAPNSGWSALRSRYERLMEKGEDVVYYGDKTDLGNANAVLLHWKTSDGKYRVVFGDLSERTVSPEVLIKLQDYMLQEKKTK
jgi:hypothetical protein